MTKPPASSAEAIRVTLTLQLRGRLRKRARISRLMTIVSLRLQQRKPLPGPSRGNTICDAGPLARP